MKAPSVDWKVVSVLGMKNQLLWWYAPSLSSSTEFTQMSSGLLSVQIWQRLAISWPGATVCML
jgi:hypothetical protein